MALDVKDDEEFKLRPLDPMVLTDFPEELGELHGDSAIMLIRFADKALRERHHET